VTRARLREVRVVHRCRRSDGVPTKLLGEGEWVPWNRLLRVSLLILVLASFSAASAEPRRVLLLHSFSREVGPFDTFVAGFRAALERQSRDPVEFYDVSLEPAGPSETAEQAIIGFLLSMFASRPPDLIVPIGGPASTFAHRYQQQLFPATPILMAAVDERHLHEVTLAPTEAAVAVKHDAPRAIETIRRVLPQTSTVFVVIGNSPLERFWRDDLAREFQRFGKQLTFLWGNELSFDEMLKRCSTLPPNSAIFYALLSVDAAGFSHTEVDALQQLHAVANAPIFGVESSQMGRGIVGGPLISLDDLSRNAAVAALRILNHDSPESVRIPPQLPGPNIFDWRELRRWHIDENLLPEGSVIQFLEPTLWQRYKWYVLSGALVCFLEALLISSLLANLARRRRVEQSLRESREALSKMSQRLIEAQEKERSWIALELHDDINQRLAVLAMQLSLLGKSLPASVDAARKRLTVANQHVTELISGIQALSRRLHSPSLKHVGLAQSAEALCNEFSAAHQIHIEFRSDNIPKDLPEDISVCLFRVLQEALQNVAKHSGTERVQILLTAGTDTVQLTVRDEGNGFQVKSTRGGNGLGLPSMMERLKLVNGHVSIDSEPGRGTVVQARVPVRSTKKAWAG
jgi:signal transduction histidine kinase